MTDIAVQRTLAGRLAGVFLFLGHGFRKCIMNQLEGGTMMGKAYVIPERGETLQLPDGQKWIVLRLSMGVLGRDTCKRGVPEQMRNVVVPQFLMIATDREAAKQELLTRLDGLFDTFEACEAWDANKKTGG